jgi:hypothetical protein
LATGLVSFNVGVELGQASIILVAAPLLAAVTRLPKWGARWVTLGSGAIGLAGSFWFISRVIFP